MLLVVIPSVRKPSLKIECFGFHHINDTRISLFFNLELDIYKMYDIRFYFVPMPFLINKKKNHWKKIADFIYFIRK